MPLLYQQILVITVTLVLIILLLREKIRPSALFFGSTLIFLLTGIIQTKDLLSAISNQSILSIFMLIFLMEGVKNNFNLIARMDVLFGKTNSPRLFMLKMTSMVAFFSAFLNNTPLVALFMPYIYQWSKKRNVSPAKLLMPLSFAAILGGMITVIGTSTNLVLNGLIQSKGAETPGILDYLIPGLLVTITCLAFLYFIGYKWLPNHKVNMLTSNSNNREYFVEVKVIENASVIGKNITDANLRNLNGIYLFEIIRNNQRISSVEPHEVIQEGDRLVFTGDTENIVELLERDKDFCLIVNNKEDNELWNRNIIETVIPINSELIGHTLKQVEFRENYGGAVVAVHRNGAQLSGKVGEIVLQAGDMLLISPGFSFQQRMNQKNDLYMVSVVRNSSKVNRHATKGFLLTLLLVIAGMATGYLDLFFALVLLTSYMVIFKLLSIAEIKKMLDIDLFVILIASLTFSAALIQSGVAEIVANQVIQVFRPFGIKGIIIGVYLLTLILTSFVTHVAAVSIVFPIVYGVIQQVPDANPIAFYIAIAFAASASFHVPFTYQTNLMVYGPGNYKFKDFLKVGTPITIIYSAVTLAFILLYY